ncbi:DUF4266 domain-containing protein [Chitinophaga sancti]|uniref:DUF4266 domain-containing protein n=1 Tax=Chitinophaga sancti TaxID=1004 RepID=A0A1K1SMI0_9BACT|nr:DUF4266 domain-containing protein [Chitinophaga sancti]WQD63885.1 DUF4266 domain-containing protein [Chitinophaga sancti]WQG90490.1 DUF4266 domain-containing protein [Chitinophaga sancti]SFW85287.1 protein of unknown function [Chitinophaga sancti]
MIKKSAQLIVLAGIGIMLSAACTTVKEYQKNRLNDGEMTLGNRKVEKTELSFESYREGASGANGAKSGGGCGCN